MNQAEQIRRQKQQQRLQDAAADGFAERALTDSQRVERAAARQTAEQERGRGAAAPLGGYEFGAMPTNPAADKGRRRLETAAATFSEDAEFETYIRWEKEGNPKFDQLPPVTRAALGYYKTGKAAKKQVG